MTNDSILEKRSIVKKAHLSNTHFTDAVNHLSLGKSKFGRCSINNNAEVLKGSETVSSRSSTSSSNSDNFTYQPVIPTSKRFKILCKSKKQKINKLKNMGAPKYYFFFRKKMILLNETL